MTGDLLQVRRDLKERKPVFIRQDNPKRRKLNDKWRKPKGIHSKIRHKFKGRRKMPSPGYKSPKKIRGFHNSGLKQISVASPSDLQGINKSLEGAVISKNTGMKKRLGIFQKAKELGIHVLNLNIDEQIKKIEEFINSKKKKEAKEAKKEPKEKETKQKESKEKSAAADEGKTAKEPKGEVQLSEADKKEADKKEKDKVLTKRI